MTDQALPVIAIHGGAGTLNRSRISPQQEAAYHDALAAILRAGARVLAEGGTALDAVSLAVDLLEDSPLFNAGHGAVFTSDETHELDAAIMDGASLRAGAVACVSRIKRPLRLRCVYTLPATSSPPRPLPHPHGCRFLAPLAPLDRIPRRALPVVRGDDGHPRRVHGILRRRGSAS